MGVLFEKVPKGRAVRYTLTTRELKRSVGEVFELNTYRATGNKYEFVGDDGKFSFFPVGPWVVDGQKRLWVFLEDDDPQKVAGVFKAMKMSVLEEELAKVNRLRAEIECLEKVEVSK